VSRAPHSFVVHRGKTGKFVQELCKDFRKVMEPFTATNIKIRPKNVIKDFVHVAGLLKVSHLTMFTKTPLGPYMKIARFPRGPTLTFKIKEYSLGRDVRSSLKRQITYEKQYLHHPLLVLNNFPSEEREFQLCTSMFQNMFPTINVTKVKLNDIRRCVLINYNKETGLIDFRHYTIKVVPVGLNRGVKKIVSSRIPNLGRLEDLADIVTGAGNISESEAEDENSKVVLPQEMSVRGAMSAQQSSVRLVELGPRISMELIKIEDGLLDGEVMFHKYVTKTEEEVKAIRLRREQRRKEKERRRKDQDSNVKKKEDEKKKHKEKSMFGMKANEPEFTGKDKKAIRDFQGENAKESDDDEEWYRKEVGAEPDAELFSKSNKPGEGRTNMSKRFSKKPQADGDDKRIRGRFDRSRSKGDDDAASRGRGGHGASRGRGGPGASRGRGGPGASRGRGGPGASRGRGGAGASRGGGREGKQKRATNVYNSDGVGPNYKPGRSGSTSKSAGKSRGGVRGGKIQKNRKR